MRGKIIAASIALAIAASLIGLKHHTSRFDYLISQTAARNSIDFHIVKALIYEESWFRSDARGAAGEIGLMQITKAAATDFAVQKGFPLASDRQLLEPELNLEIGCWYLKKSLEHYKGAREPELYALLRYNAGESRSDNWLRMAQKIPHPQAGISMESHLLSFVDFPRTREYAQRILQRARNRNYWF
jgi:soluble lytic murein transglycosylase